MGSDSITTDASGVSAGELRYKAWGCVRYTSGTTDDEGELAAELRYKAWGSVRYLPVRRDQSQPAAQPSSSPRIVRMSIPPRPLSLANLALPGMPTAK